MPNRKKIIITAVAVVLLTAFLVILKIWSSPQKKEENPSLQPEITALPTPSPNEERTTVQSPSNATEIKKTLDEFSADVPKNKDGYVFLRLVDKNQKPISLDDFSKAVGMNVNPEIRSLLNPMDFNIISCSDKNGKNALGIVLNVKLFRGSYKGNLYTDELAFMKNWEKSLLSDTKNVIFPGVNFSDAELKNTEFKDGKYRYTDIILSDGSKQSINYTIVFDSIIIATSFDCIDKIATSFEALEP
jgi:hypothetical protein